MLEIKKSLSIVVVIALRLMNIDKKLNNIWLIGTASGKAYADNCASLYEYILNNCNNISVYWVINADSQDLSKVKSSQNENILYRNSIKANVYALLANVHIVSHGSQDISKFSGKRLQNTLKVHLGHGIQALKQIKADSNKLASFNQDYDLFTSSSTFEKEIKSDWGVEKEKIHITGLPRFDDLLKKHKNSMQYNVNSKEILYMPTWRDWLVSNSDIKNTTYYSYIYNLLTNSGLLKYLKSEDIILKVYLHRNMHNHFEIFDSLSKENIKILPLYINVQDEIIKSQLLITDYSSVCWDFLYINRPVIFYQFDVDTYLKERGSYIDLKDNLFGPVLNKSKDVVTKIQEKFSNNHYNDNDMIETWKNKMFKHRDSNNCQRVVQVISDKLNEMKY